MLFYNVLQNGLNETLNQTANGVNQASLTFKDVIPITTHPLLITAFAIVWFLPILIYILVASFVKGRSSSGQATTRPMITYRNFWIPVLIWGLGQLFFFLVFLVFPIWLKIIEIFI